MPLLYYWRDKNYRRDLDIGVGYHLNQASPLMHRIDTRDSLWAFTQAHGGHYGLAAEFVVRAKTLSCACKPIHRRPTSAPARRPDQPTIIAVQTPLTTRITSRTVPAAGARPVHLRGAKKRG